MIKNGKRIKDSNILVLGLTFKENCPDVRNTKVVDIIDELKDYGSNIDVYEPWIDEKDKKYYEYNFILNPFENNKKYDAIVVAVGHDEFKEITQEQYESLIEGDNVIIDVKCIVPNPTWKL